MCGTRERRNNAVLAISRKDVWYTKITTNMICSPLRVTLRTISLTRCKISWKWHRLRWVWSRQLAELRVLNPNLMLAHCWHPNQSMVYYTGCSEGWTLHDDMCYKGSQDRVVWEEAKLECEAMQAVLAFLHNEEVISFIHSLVSG